MPTPILGSQFLIDSLNIHLQALLTMVKHALKIGETHSLGLGGGDGEGDGRLAIATAVEGGGGGLSGLSRQTPPKTRPHVDASPSDALLASRYRTELSRVYRAQTQSPIYTATRASANTPRRTACGEADELLSFSKAVKRPNTPEKEYSDRENSYKIIWSPEVQIMANEFMLFMLAHLSRIIESFK